MEKAGLSFSDVCVDVTEKRILWSVSGSAKPGKVLALMGPSGKSVFFNIDHMMAQCSQLFDSCLCLSCL